MLATSKQASKQKGRSVDISLRPAKQADAEAVAEVYLASRRAFISFAPLAHSDAEVREWIANVLIPSGAVTVAVSGDQVVGMMATSHEEGCGWIDQFYVAPASVGAGIGSLLLAWGKRELGSPIRLYTFQANAGARRFYERHSFEAVAFSNGRNNEEKCPDVLYEWNLNV